MKTLLLDPMTNEIHYSSVIKKPSNVKKKERFPVSRTIQKHATQYKKSVLSKGLYTQYIIENNKIIAKQSMCKEGV